jgi:ubiquinone/menaquinone biosynthesis C-methylase UbiE
MRSQRLNIVSQNEQTIMGNIKEPFNKFAIKLQESFLTKGSKKRIQLMLQYIDITSHDVLLDVGGNTGKITEVYARDCKEVVVLEPKHAVVEYGRTYRPNIKFVEAGAENIPLPGEHFDKVVASASFHHFPKQDRSLEEMKRVLKSNGKMIIIEIDPNTARGKRLKICEGILHTGAKFYDPLQLKKKVEDHGMEVLSINSTTLGYFLTAVKSVQK